MHNTHSRAIVPESLAACEIESSAATEMREKIETLARDDEDRKMLLAMILGEE